MKKLNNISILLIFAALFIASCSKITPLTEKSKSENAQSATQDYVIEPSAMNTSNNGPNNNGGSITDPDNDYDHDRDKAKPKAQ